MRIVGGVYIYHNSLLPENVVSARSNITFKNLYEKIHSTDGYGNGQQDLITSLMNPIYFTGECGLLVRYK